VSRWCSRRDPGVQPQSPRRALGVAYVPLEPPGPQNLSVAIDTPQVLEQQGRQVVSCP